MTYPKEPQMVDHKKDAIVNTTKASRNIAQLGIGADTDKAVRAIRNNEGERAAFALSDTVDVRKLKPSDDHAVSGDALARVKAGQPAVVDQGKNVRKK
jgi:hypothetical protein